jgi:hypothetical protein
MANKKLTSFEEFGGRPISNAGSSFEEFGGRPLTEPPGGIPRAGQTIDPALVPSKLRELLPTKEQAPEFIGSMAGGLASGSRFNPAGSVTSGLGAAGGELVRQGLEKTGVFETPAPQSFSELGKRVGEAFLRGTGSQLLGAGIGKIGEKVLSPFAKNPVFLQEVEKEIGTKLPLTKVSEGNLPKLLEKSAENMPFGGWITEQKANMLRGFKNYAERVGESIAENRPPEVTGNLAKESLQGFRETFRQLKKFTL